MDSGHRFTTLLMDMDNTIFDFDAAEREGVCEVLRENGFTPDDELIERYHEVNQECWQAFERGDITRDQIFENRFPRFFAGLGKEIDAPEVEKAYRARLSAGSQLLPGAGEMCEWLSQSYDLYIITNGVAVTQKSRLNAAGIGGYFKNVFISEELGSQKPQKEFFDACLPLIDEKDRSRMLIIGDSLTSDIQSGINTGIATCWVNPSGAPAKEGCVPDMEIKSLEDLKDIL